MRHTARSGGSAGDTQGAEWRTRVTKLLSVQHPCSTSGLGGVARMRQGQVALWNGAPVGLPRAGPRLGVGVNRRRPGTLTLRHPDVYNSSRYMTR